MADSIPQHLRIDLIQCGGGVFGGLLVRFLPSDLPIRAGPLLDPCPAATGFILHELEAPERGRVVRRSDHIRTRTEGWMNSDVHAHGRQMRSVLHSVAHDARDRAPETPV